MNRRIVILLLAVFSCQEAFCQQTVINNKEPIAMKNDECLICGAPLEYLSQDVIMECAICHKKEPSKTRCTKGHYVCDECHMSGMDSVVAICMNDTSRNPNGFPQSRTHIPQTHPPQERCVSFFYR